MLEPRKVKFRRRQKGRTKGKANRGFKLVSGDFGLKCLEPGWITARQIEAARVAITRKLKRSGKVWITIFPDKPISKKPLEVRMGKGKGPLDHWVAVVKPGRIIFEIEATNEELAREALRLGANKLPLKCKVVCREDIL